MKLSRNQKRYAYILGACLLALGADRLFLSPSAAEADDPAGPAAGTTTTPPLLSRDPLPTTSVPHEPLADRFTQLADEYDVDLASLSDPFQVPTEWLPETADPGAGPVVESDHPDVETFRRSHRLNAVMALDSGGYAIVDGRRLRIGQEIDGFQLIEIRNRSIVLESRDLLRVELRLLDGRTTGGSSQRPE